MIYAWWDRNKKAGTPPRAPAILEPGAVLRT
jgi:hypothetical protein